MKVLVLNGSPHPNGATADMVSAFEKGAKEAGHEVIIFAVARMNVKGCLGCEYCHNKGEGKCVQQDDMKALYPEFLSADMVVFASPIYYFTLSAQLQAVIHRTYAFGIPKNVKQTALILSSGDAFVYGPAITQYYQSIVEYWGVKNAGILKEQIRRKEAGTVRIWKKPERRTRVMKRIICMVLVFALIAAPSALAEGHRELENYTRYFDYQPEVNEPLGMIPGTDHSTLVLYFSRVGNTAFPEDVDAVSYATLNLDSEGKLIGTAQMAACWIAEATGGDVFPIQTAYTYPESFEDTITVVVGQEEDNIQPQIAAYPEDLSGYDTVWLVLPIWAYTICKPARAFLENIDLSGKTVYVFTTHCGSGMADAVQRVQDFQPNADVRRGLAIASDNPQSSQDEVLQYIHSVQK